MDISEKGLPCVNGKEKSDLLKKEGETPKKQETTGFPTIEFGEGCSACFIEYTCKVQLP